MRKAIVILLSLVGIIILLPLLPWIIYIFILMPLDAVITYIDKYEYRVKPSFEITNLTLENTNILDFEFDHKASSILYLEEDLNKPHTFTLKQHNPSTKTTTTILSSEDSRPSITYDEKNCISLAKISNSNQVLLSFEDCQNSNLRYIIVDTDTKKYEVLVSSNNRPKTENNEITVYGNVPLDLSKEGLVFEENTRTISIKTCHLACWMSSSYDHIFLQADKAYMFEHVARIKKPIVFSGTTTFAFMDGRKLLILEN
jgi:protease II